MNTKRLQKLIDFMRKLPKNAEQHFNMKAWVMHNGNWREVIGQHGIAKPADVTKEKLIQCGMTACAFGWGAVVPEFRRAGLKLEIRESTRGFKEILEPSYKGKRDLEAAAAFFEVSQDDAEALFGYDNKDASPKAWAKRASDWIKAQP